MSVLFIPLVKVCVKHTYISYGLQKKYVAYSHSFLIVQVTFFTVYHRYRLFSVDSDSKRRYFKLRINCEKGLVKRPLERLVV